MTTAELPPVNNSRQFPDVVRDRQAENLVNPATVEGAAVASVTVRPRARIGTGPAAPARFINVKDFGAIGDGTTDDTVAIRAAAAAGSRLYFPSGTYKVSSVADNTALLSFTNIDGIEIDASEATISNPTSYTTDNVTPMFKFENCKNIVVRVGKYIGFTLPTPTTDLGYKGSTFVFAVNGCDGLRVDATLVNCRYGVLTGSYPTPALGNCSNFDLTLRSTFVGYTIAAYLASNIRFSVDSDSMHRAVYLAGCRNVRGTASWKDMYIAPIAVLLTDALTAGTDAAAQIDPVGTPTSSRGCSDIDIVSIDKGSTVLTATEGYAAGISISRVDPMAYRNIRLQVQVKATDTVSLKMNGFILNSSGPTVWSRYTYAWESNVLLENIEVSGIVDKSATTLSNGAVGAFTVRAHDTGTPAHAATVRGLSVNNLIVLRGSAGYAASAILARGAASPIKLKGFSMPSDPLTLDTPNAYPVSLDGCAFSSVDVGSVTGGSRVQLGPGTVVGALAGTAATFIEMNGGALGGGGPIIKQKEVSLTLTGSTVTWSGAIPTGCILLGVAARIKTTITGATGYQLGVTGDLTRFGNRNDLTAGLAIGPAASTDTTVRYYQANTDIIVTAKTSAFTAGVLRVVLSYIEFPALTS